MSDQGTTTRWCSPQLVAALLALMAAVPAFGFGGHPFPPAAPIVPIIQDNPDQPGAGSGTPSPGDEPIPPVLLEPTVDDLLPPNPTDGGDIGPTPPPDASTPNTTPEPATLVLGLLGAGLGGAWARRRSRRE